MFLKNHLGRLRVALPASACLLWGAALAQTTVVGKIPGEFAVSPSGAATYRIPIEVPPGVAGMQPQLALSYNSQAGNGIMGMGWNIEGLSAITRCPKTMATDGVRGGVNFNTEDRFCLDGQRLINVAGAYGTAGSEYRTEIESFSKITAVGAAGGSAANGPERFTVQTKAGLTLEYGATTDSRIEAQGRSVVRVWALNRTIDARGNSINYNYTEDNANGQYLINAVSYAGNSVRFAYEGRPDRFAGYQSGSRISQIARLKQVEVFMGNARHRRTVVEYLPIALPTDKSRAGSLTHCTASQQCLALLTLTYPAAQAVAFGHREVVPGDGPGYSPQAVDINADGRADVILWHSSPSYGSLSLRSKLGDGSGQYGHHEQTIARFPGYGHTPHYVDVNGDGKVDILYWYFDTFTTRPGGSGSWDSAYEAKRLNIGTLLGDGQGNFGALVSQNSVESEDTHSIVPADLNGDGRTDLVQMIAGPLGISVKARLGDSARNFNTIETVFAGEKPGYREGPSSSAPVLLPKYRLGDINGDGVLDIAYWYPQVAGGRDEDRQRVFRHGARDPDWQPGRDGLLFGQRCLEHGADREVVHPNCKSTVWTRAKARPMRGQHQPGRRAPRSMP